MTYASPKHPTKTLGLIVADQSLLQKLWDFKKCLARFLECLIETEFFQNGATKTKKIDEERASTSNCSASYKKKS